MKFYIARTLYNDVQFLRDYLRFQTNLQRNWKLGGEKNG